MDFSIPQELSAVRESFAAFVEREVRPAEERFREAFARGEFPEEARQAAAAIKRRSCEVGFYAAYMPPAVGGWGLSDLGTTFLIEDAARSGLRFARQAIGPPDPAAPTPLLLELPGHLHERYLGPLMRGEQAMCFALTEPEAGSDAQAIRTRAERTEAGWVLDGTKHYITGGDRADFAVVFARTDPELAGQDAASAAAKPAHGGISAFVVPREAYRVGKIQHTMADSHPAELVLEGSRIPADHVIGEVGFGFYAAMRFLNRGRAFIGAQCLGLADWCLSQAVEHAKTRTAFGRPLAAFQGVSFPLAESKAELEAMRWLTYHLAWRCDQGEPPVLESSIVKYFNTERAFAIADRCLQVFGGQGLLTEGPVEAALRHLRMLRVVEGASEVQKVVIARALGL